MLLLLPYVLLPPYVLSIAMPVTATAMGVNCNHACCCHCRTCCLWPWVSPPPSCISSIAVGVTTTMQVTAAGHACCLWLYVLSLPPCMLLQPCALLLQAMCVAPGPIVQLCNRIKKVSEKNKHTKETHQLWVSPLPYKSLLWAVHVICGHVCCCCHHACYLWPYILLPPCMLCPSSRHSHCRIFVSRAFKENEVMQWLSLLSCHSGAEPWCLARFKGF